MEHLAEKILLPALAEACFLIAAVRFVVLQWRQGKTPAASPEFWLYVGLFFLTGAIFAR